MRRSAGRFADEPQTLHFGTIAMQNPRYRVFEIVNGDGLPTLVGCCRDDQQPATMPGESLYWLLGAALPINEPQARRMVRARVAQVCRWSTGDATRRPIWLRNRLPIPPLQRDHGQPVLRFCPDGRVERFSSIRAAARAIGRHRVVVDRRLRNGRVDHCGCHWRFADPGDGVAL